MRIKSANDRLPISTRAASIFIPIRIRPDAVMAALSGPAGLTDATSKAGAAAGVWPRATPAATSSAALIVRRKVLGMFNLNPPVSAHPPHACRLGARFGPVSYTHLRAHET